MQLVRDVVTRFLQTTVPPTAVASIMRQLPCDNLAVLGALDVVALREVMSHIETGVKTFGGKTKLAMVPTLRKELTSGLPPNPRIERLTVKSDVDVLNAQRVCQRLVTGFFSVSDVTRLVTAVSELARNIYMYAGSGEMTLNIAEDLGAVKLSIVARDRGPGISNLPSILAGTYTSKTGLGRGLIGTKALLDDLQIRTAPNCGTTVTGNKQARLR